MFTCQVEVHHIAVLQGLLPKREKTGGKEAEGSQLVGRESPCSETSCLERRKWKVLRYPCRSVESHLCLHPPDPGHINCPYRTVFPLSPAPSPSMPACPGLNPSMSDPACTACTAPCHSSAYLRVSTASFVSPTGSASANTKSRPGVLQRGGGGRRVWPG